MNEKHRIGYVDRATVDNSHFADLNMPEAWFRYASAMRRAADALQIAFGERERQRRIDRQFGNADFVEHLISSHHDHGPLLLCAGLSTEALLKALLIRRDPALVAAGHSSLGHDQVDLANRATVTLVEAEVILLQLLSDFVVFAGRYPSTTKAKSAPIGVLIGDEAFSEYVRFYDRLTGLFREEAVA